MKFRVIDKQTSKEADPYEIALHEEWASCLVYCDMEGFAITEDGSLVLMDECGNVVYCDADRFKVVFEDERPLKAMEAVKRYCEKKKTCDGCPLHTLNDYGYCICHKTPASWEIKKEDEANDKTT